MIYPVYVKSANASFLQDVKLDFQNHSTFLRVRMRFFAPITQPFTMTKSLVTSP